VPGARGAIGRVGIVFAKGAVVAPVSTFGGAPGATGAIGRGAPGADGIGGRGAPPDMGAVDGAIGTVAAGGGLGAAEGAGGGAMGRAGGGIEGGGIIIPEGAGGNLTGDVEAFVAGGGSGAEGSWIGAVARFGAEIGTLDVTGFTGDVASRGCVAPSPGRARRVMRTVSFFSGTADVFGVLGGGGVGRLGESLMSKRKSDNLGKHDLADLAAWSQSLSLRLMELIIIFLNQTPVFVISNLIHSRLN